MRELEITPEPDDPAVAAAIARALEQLEREEGLTAPLAARALGVGRGGAPRARRRWPRLTSSSAPGCTSPCGSRTAWRCTASATSSGSRPRRTRSGCRRRSARRSPARSRARPGTERSCASGSRAADGDAELSAERRAALAPEPLRLTVLGGWYAPGYLLREHKLTSHFHGVQGRRLARAAGYDDALLVAHDGRVGEATNANVAFLVAEYARHAVGRRAAARGLPRRAARGGARARRGGGVATGRARRAGRRRRRAAHVLAARAQRGARARRPPCCGRCRRDLLAALREGVAAAARAHALALP